MRTRPDPKLLAFGRRLRACRLQVGWSQERLHAESGIHWSYVSQIERGYRNVGLLHIYRLADTLGVSPARLVAD